MHGKIPGIIDFCLASDLNFLLIRLFRKIKLKRARLLIREKYLSLRLLITISDKNTKIYKKFFGEEYRLTI